MRCLRVPLVPADQHADVRITSLPHPPPVRRALERVALVLRRVSRREVVLLVEQRVVGMCIFRYTPSSVPSASMTAAGAVHASGLTLEDRTISTISRSFASACNVVTVGPGIGSASSKRSPFCACRSTDS